jgi:hypothetical protein
MNFNPVGKYNIGITAGIETSVVKGEWIEGCNRMNFVITSSEFAKKTFLNQWIMKLKINKVKPKAV